MTEADQLLLKLATGHGPFRICDDTWGGACYGHTVMLCEHCGERWCRECQKPNYDTSGTDYRDAYTADGKYIHYVHLTRRP